MLIGYKLRHKQLDNLEPCLEEVGTQYGKRERERPLEGYLFLIQSERHIKLIHEQFDDDKPSLLETSFITFEEINDKLICFNNTLSYLSYIYIHTLGKTLFILI